MLACTQFFLARKFGQKAAASAAAAVVGGAATGASPPHNIDVDSSRFTSTPYKSGKTSTSSLFKKSFLDDDLLGTKKRTNKKKGSGDTFLSLDVDGETTTGDKLSLVGGSTTNNGEGSATPKRRRRRADPFSTFATEKEKEQFEKLVKKNMKVLNNTDEKATAELAKQITAAAEEHKAATGTTLPVMKAPQLASLKHKKRGEISKIISSNLRDENARGATLLTDVILKKGSDAATRNRAKSSFYSTRAIDYRGGSFSTPLKRRVVKKKKLLLDGTKRSSGSASSKTQKTTTTTTNEKAVVVVVDRKPKEKYDKNDALNPVNITSNFFTSYEKKQYSRLKNASLYLRDPRKHRMNRARRGLYRWWDRVLEGVKAQ